MIFLTLLFATLLVDVDPKIQWKFKSDDATHFWGVFLTTKIGTPGQSVRLSLSQDQRVPYLGIPSYRNMYGGTYNPSKSSTYKLVQYFGDENNQGETATETFAFAGATVENMPFKVYDRGMYSHGDGSVGLAYTDDAGSSFIQTLLATEEQKTAVVSFDQVDYYTETGPISGTLTLAGQPTECSSNWTVVKEVKHKDAKISWAFKADMLTVGKYQKRSPGIVGISFSEDILYVSESAYFNIVRAVGGDDLNVVPCDGSTKIVLSVGDIDLEVGPKTYLSPPDDDQCVFAAEQYPEDDYRLPVSVLRDFCIRYNYETKEVGLSPRLK